MGITGRSHILITPGICERVEANVFSLIKHAAVYILLLLWLWRILHEDYS